MCPHSSVLTCLPRLQRAAARAVTDKHSCRYLSSYTSIYVLVLVYMCPNTTPTCRSQRVPWLKSTNAGLLALTSASVGTLASQVTVVWAHICYYYLLLLHVCPHTALLLYMCPHTTILMLLYICGCFGFSVATLCVLILLYVILLYMCPHTAIYYICVLVLLNVSSSYYTTIYVSSCYYIFQGTFATQSSATSMLRHSLNRALIEP